MNREKLDLLESKLLDLMEGEIKEIIESTRKNMVVVEEKSDGDSATIADVKIGELFVEQGRILDKRDVFYLFYEELKDTDLDYIELVEKRKVQYKEFESNESMYEDFVKNPNSYDILVPSDYMIDRLIKENRVSKITKYFRRNDNRWHHLL